MDSGYSTKEGDLITFKWEELDSRKRRNPDEQGWLTHRLIAYVNGKEAGYLAISYIPEKLAKKLYSTVWHWLEANGLADLEKCLNNKKINLDCLYKSLTSRYDWKKHIEISSMNISSLSKQEYSKYQKERDSFLQKQKAFHSNKKYGYNAFLVQNVNVPKVDYIYIEPNFRRRGIALALYQEGARRMAKKNMPLYSGWSRSPGAAKAWEKMKKMKEIPVFPEGKRQRIDYRKIASLPNYKFFTKDGKPITFRWFNLDPKERWDERGYVVHKLVAYVDRKEAGYLKISYIPKRRWDKIYPTFWHWKVGPIDRFSRPEEKLWRRNHKDLDLLAQAIYNVPLKNFLSHKGVKDPSELSGGEYEEWKEERDFFLKQTKINDYPEYKKKKTFLVNKPLVDYIRVYPPFRRQGVALALYQMGARIMAKKGLPLYASGVQSEEAQKAWEKMKGMKKIPIMPQGKRTKIDYSEG